MTLKDHFHGPLAKTIPWNGVHSMWTAMIAVELNRLLPTQFRAIPQNRSGNYLEVDVATVEWASAKVGIGGWQPEAPARTKNVHLPELDHYEIRIVKQEASSKLVGAIELVSPANKDRPGNRVAFAGKCVGYLRMGIGVIVVDVVTNRHQCLLGLIEEMLELDSLEKPSEIEDGSLYAVAYRTAWNDDAPRMDRSRLEEWPHILTIGGELPTLPLWLASEFPVPVDLAKSYTAVCESLRME